jgi:hypothetical protein
LQVVGIVIQRVLSEKDFIFSFGEEEAFSLARVHGLGVFFMLGAFSIVVVCFPIIAELFTSKSWLNFAEAWTLDCDPCGSISLGAEISLIRLIKIFATVLLFWCADLIHWGFLDAFSWVIQMFFGYSVCMLVIMVACRLLQVHVA